MIKITGVATSQEQAASAITDLRNRNLINYGTILYLRKKASFPEDDFYTGNSDSIFDSTNVDTTISSSPGMSADGGLISRSLLAPTATTKPDTEEQERLIGPLIAANEINQENVKEIEQWLAEDKYVIFIECKQEVPHIIELLEGLHGIDNVREI